MSPEFSRRIGAIMNTKTIIGLGGEGHADFLKAVIHAGSFSRLNSAYQDLVKRAEAEKRHRRA